MSPDIPITKRSLIKELLYIDCISSLEILSKVFRLPFVFLPINLSLKKNLLNLFDAIVDISELSILILASTLRFDFFNFFYRKFSFIN